MTVKLIPPYLKLAFSACNLVKIVILYGKLVPTVTGDITKRVEWTFEYASYAPTVAGLALVCKGDITLLFLLTCLV